MDVKQFDLRQFVTNLQCLVLQAADGLPDVEGGDPDRYRDRPVRSTGTPKQPEQKLNNEQNDDSPL